MKQKRYDFVREDAINRIYFDRAERKFVSTGRGDNDSFAESEETVNNEFDITD